MKLYYSPGASFPLSPTSPCAKPTWLSSPCWPASRPTNCPMARITTPSIRSATSPCSNSTTARELREGPAIVQYIADQAPVKNLAPANGTLPRYRLQEWLTFIGTEIHRSFSPMFNPAMPEEARKIYRDRLAVRYLWLDGELAGKQYLMGEHFSVADGYLFAVTRWAKPLNVDLAPFANVLAHHERVAARPAVQEALKVEGLLAK